MIFLRKVGKHEFGYRLEKNADKELKIYDRKVAIGLNKNILICVYRDTTPLGYDEVKDENLVNLEVPWHVIQQYMKKNGLPKNWLNSYTADDTIDFYNFAKDSIVNTYPA